MNQVFFTVVTIYGVPYMARYATDAITSMVINKTTDAVKTKVSNVVRRTNDPIICEYEYINIDDHTKTIIPEPITYVTSIQTIDKSWINLEDSNA